MNEKNKFQIFFYTFHNICYIRGMAKQKTTKEYVYPLKIDASIVESLKRLAKKNHRTIRGELTLAIEKHLKNGN